MAGTGDQTAMAGSPIEAGWRRRPERGDAGLPAILIMPILLVLVLHLVNASQQLYERREAYAVAATAVRVAGQADPAQVRSQQTAAIDQSKARAAVDRFVASEGYQLIALEFVANADGTTGVRAEVDRPIDYIFPNPFGLASSIAGEAEATLVAGVTGPGR